MQTVQKLGETGFNATVTILEKWQCSHGQIFNILGLNESSYYKAQEDVASVKFTRCQLERMGIILNIHSVLRTVFSNSDNVYGYMKMSNNNPFFGGKMPLEIIENGSRANLKQVYQHIDALQIR